MIEFIEYGGEHYVLQEPTIKVWSEVMKFRELLDDEELYIKMISVITGLKREDILKADASQINEVGEKLKTYLWRESKQLFPEFTHNKITYRLCDFNKMSFGQFVDIETFLKKDESYRIANLNELCAYLYCEKDLNYSDSDFQKRIEVMKDVPVKYVESSLFFFVEFRKGITKTFSTLFPETAVVEDNEDKNNFGEFWGWYAIISRLAEDRIWLFNEITNLPLISCLNHVSYIYDVNQQRKQEAEKRN